MLGAHYSIPLPADYDMKIISNRVEAKASYWDSRTGLLCKVFCVNEVGELGAAVNTYAPFYVWANPVAAKDFLTGAEYGGLSASFGRVPVRLTSVLHADLGDGVPEFVRWETTPVADLGSLPGPEKSTVITLDSARWLLHRFTLLRERPVAEQSATVRTMRVLHLSRPA